MIEDNTNNGILSYYYHRQIIIDHQKKKKKKTTNTYHAHARMNEDTAMSRMRLECPSTNPARGVDDVTEDPVGEQAHAGRERGSDVR